ncbi:NAD(P)-binding protein [Fragilariopsis cylindrus CCMP1102]|uniref:NAD(P)-binding protein n=1 Tax=Fragilariopsis cylindrus CCMP1102 TaxID=635003 RepID=A0A1E7FLR7_9STRA|nr:NAD(P)-binding protein [Fragilariopsis cylindrus CCMP1102]|eukprot:OEU18753.1 NAD(P)-binding protein [Fragilariopsis cylindrus CCMP1102]
MKLSILTVSLLSTLSVADAFRSSFAGSRAGPVATARTNDSTMLCMKTIAVFGASGLTGSECVFQALKEGDTVIGLARTPSNLKIPEGSGGDNAGKPLNEPNLTMIGGDVTNKDDVAKVFAGQDVDGVIIALGGKTSDVGETMLTDGTNTVIAAMKEKGVKRLAVVTSIGAGDSESQAPLMFKALMMTVMKKIFVDKNNQEDATTKSGLEYCIVRPGGLTVDAPTGIINVIDGKAGSIPRADVAQFCLDAVRVEDFPYIGKAACISSVGGTAWKKDRSKAARGEM